MDSTSPTGWSRPVNPSITTSLSPLPELPTTQMTLREWLALHPHSTVMLPDPGAHEAYRSFGFDRL